MDLFSPLVLLPLYWTPFRREAGASVGAWSTIGFVALAGVWAEAQGMHLAANSIGHLLGDAPDAPLVVTHSNPRGYVVSGASAL